MKLSDFVFEFLASRGAQHVFMLPGGGAMHLVDSLGKSKLAYTCCLHEQSAALAAQAYADYAGRLGVCLVTSGPGATNAMTGAAAAWVESSPVVFISGQAKRADMGQSQGIRSGGVQELDIVSMVTPITKRAFRVREPDDIADVLEEACVLALQPRQGPVWIDIPLDIQAAEVGTPAPTTERDFDACKCWDRIKYLPEHMAGVRSLLSEAKHPVLLLGNGVRGVRNLQGILDSLKIPVLTTWRAADLLPESNPWFMGRPGAIGQRAANLIQQNCDLLLVLGARLDRPQTAFNYEQFAPLATKVVVDIDSAELQKFMDVATCKLRVGEYRTACQDARAVLTSLVKLVDVDWSKWAAACRTLKNQFPTNRIDSSWRPGLVSLYALVRALSQAATPSDLLVPGSAGQCSDTFYQAFAVKAGQRLLNAPGLGAMGSALPQAMGACIAGGGRRTITVVGDGGFQLALHELETIRRLQLPIKIFVLENGAYGSIQGMQQRHFQHLVGCNAASGVTFPSTAAIGEAYHIPVVPLPPDAELRNQKVQFALSTPGPVLVSVPTDPLQDTALRISSRMTSAGAMESGMMDDLCPTLTDLQEWRGFLQNA